MIDTGYTGFLALPIAPALPLGLALVGSMDVFYADGSASTSFVTEGTVTLPNGEQVQGTITLIPGGDPLLGMEFLSTTRKSLVVGAGMWSIIDEAVHLSILDLARKFLGLDLTEATSTPPPAA